MTKKKQPLTYKNSGVDIDVGNALTQRIQPIAKKTRRPEVLTGIGGFSALCEIPKQYQEPVLVSGTDGVGTKLSLAIQTQTFQGLGIDLVAMCANDILVVGAEPLFFLDYYATGKLQLEAAETIIKSIGAGCELAKCALIGGETAEMPGLYQSDDFDLAGFCVGVVEKSQIIQKTSVEAGDILIGLSSSGPHSNGYSLIRDILKKTAISLDTYIGDKPLVELLMAPTRIYVESILQLRAKGIDIHAISHITGGGLTENLPRTLPDHLLAVIDHDSWKWPAIFNWLQENGPVEQEEMIRTFNCGVGMVICVPPNQVDQALKHLKATNETPWVIGSVSALS